MSSSPWPPGTIGRLARSDDVREALQKLDPVWDELFPAERDRIVKLLIKEAILSADGLDIGIRTNGLRSLAAELADAAEAKMAEDGATVTIHVRMIFKVRGGRKEIILPRDAEAVPRPEPNRPLVLALARAHRWQRMIDCGEVPGMEAIAAQHDVDRAYVSRIVQLAALAPDIIGAILEGQEPGGLSLIRLHRSLPLQWDVQRKSLRGASS